MKFMKSFKTLTSIALFASVILSSYNASAQTKVIRNHDFDLWLQEQQSELGPNLLGFFNEADRNGDGIFSLPQDERAFQLYFDLTGLVASVNNFYFDTEVSGTVKERILGNNESLFTIIIETKNAFINVYECTDLFGNPGRTCDDLVFGNTISNVVNGDDAALVDITFKMEIYSETGKPPFIIEAFINQSWRYWLLQMDAIGPLHEAYGGGVEEGDLGRLFWSKPGVFSTKAASEGGDDKDRKGAHQTHPSQSFYLKPIKGNN